MTDEAEAGDGRRSHGRLGFAQLLLNKASLFSPEENQARLEAAIVAGTKAERHNRVWRMGQSTIADGFVFGRLGFTHATSSTEVWDEDSQDFIEAAFPEGYTSPFAIRVSDLLVSFQLRSGQIKFQSFAGALRALMREASGEAWRVEPIVKPVTFERWRQSVSRVLSMSFALHPRNPNYKGRPLIQQAIEETYAEQLRFVAESDADALEGLNTDSEFLRQAVAHAERGYGTFSAVGERRDDDGHARRVKFDEELGETDVAPVSANAQTGEVPHETLARELAQRHGHGEPESEHQANRD